jgi:3-methyladenine DNA glycosylase AlkD
MTATEVMDELRPLGSDGYRRILMNHGVPEPILGVKIEEMKKIQKRVKKDYRLALDLYDTGVYDMMYLAGLIADDDRMTREDLQRWVDGATCEALATSTVAWVASESPHGFEMALKWIDSPSPITACAGWSTLSSLVSITENADLDIEALSGLLKRVRETIHDQPNRVRSSMNGFVIAVGSYVAPLAEVAMETANAIGPVTVDMGNTSCKVPFAPDYIEKARSRGSLGKKRKTAKC